MNSSAAGPTATLPGEVRKPKTLFQAAGLRSEPPMSLPSATGSMSSASATAAPPLDPPDVSRWIEGVARRAEHVVVALRAKAEFRHVGLADDDGAGGAHALDDVAVLLRHEIGEDARAESGAQALRQRQVLDRDRQAEQRPGLGAVGQPEVGGSSPRPGSRARPRSETIALTAPLTASMRSRNAPTTSTTGNAALADPPRQLDGRQAADRTGVRKRRLVAGSGAWSGHCSSMRKSSAEVNKSRWLGTARGRRARGSRRA